MRTAIALSAAVIAAALAPGAVASDATVRRDLARGVSQIRSSSGTVLARRLAATLARLRAEAPSTARGRRGRSLAIAGFAWSLRGARAQLDLIRNDSGNIEAAVRDAVRADRSFDRGATLLRAAGRAFALRIGRLKGH